MKTCLTFILLISCIIAKGQQPVATTTNLPGSIMPNKLSGKPPVPIELGDSVTLYIYFPRINTWNAKYGETLGTVADSILVHTDDYTSLKNFFTARDRKAEMIQKFGKVLGPDVAAGKVKIGMTKAMVEAALGNPDGTSRSVGGGKIEEQYTYDHQANGKAGHYYFVNGKLIRMKNG